MRIDKHLMSSSLLVLVCLLLPAALGASEASAVRNLAAQADALMRLVVAEMGASRAFDEISMSHGRCECRLVRGSLDSASHRRGAGHGGGCRDRSGEVDEDR